MTTFQGERQNTYSLPQSINTAINMRGNEGIRKHNENVCHELIDYAVRVVAVLPNSNVFASELINLSAGNAANKLSLNIAKTDQLMVTGSRQTFLVQRIQANLIGAQRCIRAHCSTNVYNTLMQTQFDECAPVWDRWIEFLFKLKTAKIAKPSS